MRNRKNKELFEFYPTPIEAVELARPLLDKDTKWWEPCAGDAVILNHFDNVVLGSDINPRAENVEQLDFFQSDLPAGIGGIITNPPFSLGYDIVKKALFEYKIKALMLMRVEYMSGKNRMDIRQHLTKMHIISDLVKFKTVSGRIVNGNGTGRVAWMLFEPDKQPETVEMKWVLYDDAINKK